MTSKSMKSADRYISKLTDMNQKMLVCEAFVDIAIEANCRFNLLRFLDACDISMDQWNTKRVFIDRRPKSS